MKMLKFFLLSVFTIVQTGKSMSRKRTGNEREGLLRSTHVPRETSSCDSDNFVKKNRLIMPKNPACLNVIEIELFDRSLRGTLPMEWHQLKKVKKIALSSNELNGNLPKEWKEMESLELIDLGNNHLQGPLPKEWHQLKKVKKIYLYNNKLNGNLPKEWKEMESLEIIQLDDNHLQGPLPKEWHQLKKVKEIVLFNNELNGNLPKEWKEMESLFFIILSNNQLQGVLPKEWKEMESLNLIRLSNNQFQGVLPKEWKEMKNLKTLSLDGNHFQGKLPIEWEEMENIEFINLSRNELYHTIPWEWRNLEHLEFLRSGDVSLFGREEVLSFFAKDTRVWNEIEKIVPQDMDGLKCSKDEDGKPYDFVKMVHFDLEDNPTVFAFPKSDEEFYCYSEDTFKNLWRDHYRNQKFVDPFTKRSFDVNQVKQFKRKLVQKNKQDRKYIL